MIERLPETLIEFVTEERKFVHDVANPLAIASGMLEAYRDEFERSGIKSTEALTRKLLKLDQALQRIGDVLSTHRPRLLEIQKSVEGK
jgi:hypothetical protein